MSGGSDTSIPDLTDPADVDEDAETNLHVPDLSGGASADATEISSGKPSLVDDAATVVSVEPAGARVPSASPAAPSLGDPAAAPSSRTDTRMVDLAEADEPTAPTANPKDAVAREPTTSGASRAESSNVGRGSRAAARRPRSVSPKTLVIGAIGVGASVVALTLALLPADDVTPQPTPEAPPLAVPVEVGAPSGTVFMTPPEGETDLDRRAADLAAAGRLDEAVSVYEAILEEDPGRREIAIALGALRQRLEDEALR